MNYRFFLVLSGCLLATHCDGNIAGADPCRQRVRNVAEVVPAVIAVPVAFPLYSAGQAQGYVDPTQRQLLEEVRKLNQAVDQLRREVAGGQPLKGQVDGGPGLAVAVNRCAVCHDATRAADAAKGVVLFQGGRFVADEKQARKSLAMAYKQTMPPAKNHKEHPPLTDEETAKFVEFLETWTPGPAPVKKPEAVP